MGHGDGGEGDQHVVEQGRNRADRIRQLESDPDIYQHADERKADRQHCLLLQIRADRRANAFGTEQRECADRRVVLEIGSCGLAQGFNIRELIERTEYPVGLSILEHRVGHRSVVRLSGLGITAHAIRIRRNKATEERQRPLGIEVEPVPKVRVEILVQKLEDRTREVTLRAFGVFDPNQNFILLDLIETLNERRSQGQVRDRLTQSAEVRLVAEFERDLGPTYEVDSEIEPRSEKLVSQTANNRQRRKRQGDFAVGEKRNIGVANDAHGFIQSDTEALDALAAGKNDHVKGTRNKHGRENTGQNAD